MAKIGIAGLKSIFFSFGSMVGWMNNMVLMLGTLIILQFISESRDIPIFGGRISPIKTFIWTTIGICISIFPSVLAYQVVWEHTWQCVYFFFLLGWLVNCVIIFDFFSYRYPIRHLLLHHHTVVIVRTSFLILVLVGNTSNVNIAYLDILKAPEYQRRVLSRDADIQMATHNKQITCLHPLFLPEERYLVPKTLYTVDYNNADAKAFALYYRGDTLAINQCTPLK